MSSYIVAAARLELQCLDCGIDLDNPCVRSKQEDIPEIRRLLDMTIIIAPLLAPKDSSLMVPILVHPDLGVSNMIINPEPPHGVTTFIDWQGAIIAPLFLQASTPKAIQSLVFNNIFEDTNDGTIPSLPANIDDFSSEDQLKYKRHYNLYNYNRLYNAQFPRFLPQHGLSLAYAHQHETTRLVPNILRCWADGAILLRQNLINIIDIWNESISTPCPIQFTDAERASQRTQFLEFQAYSDRLEKLCRAVGGADPEGRIGHDMDKAAVEALKVQAEEEWEQEEVNRPFPFRSHDGWSYHLT